MSHWVNGTKNLSIKQISSHMSTASGVTGCAPNPQNFSFSPHDLHAAIARCSHVRPIDNKRGAPEVLMAKALVEQHIDGKNSDFAIKSTADDLKDFIKSYFVGSVASGVSYLTMIRYGYRWADHFENVVCGKSNTGRSPDFVFDGNGSGVAIVESKGTRSKTTRAFNKTVEDGYIYQVEPHLGKPISYPTATGTTTHGYCIGAWLSSPHKAEVMIHHTAPLINVGDGGGAIPPLVNVQQHNYATAFELVNGPQVSAELREGIVKNVPQFWRFKWLDRDWLTLFQPLTQIFLQVKLGLHESVLLESSSQAFPFFAIDELTATAVFRRFSDSQAVEGETLEVPMLPQELFDSVRDRYDDEPAALFPDGLAFVNFHKGVRPIAEVVWNGRHFE